MRVEVDAFQAFWALPIFFTAMGAFFIVCHFHLLKAKPTNGLVARQTSPSSSR
jgi:hypothetical protein